MPRQTLTPVLTSAGVELGNVRHLVLGDFHTCALANADVYCWGNNQNFQISDASGEKKLYATKVGVAATLIASGQGFNVASDGNRLCAWGGNWDQQVYSGPDAAVAAPKCITTPVPIVEVVAGFRHACARAENGLISCWGSTAMGVLASVAPSASGGQPDKYPPPGRGLSEAVTRIVAGYEHSCAQFFPGGDVRCWGSNSAGQIGDGKEMVRTEEAARYHPSAVVDLPSDVLDIGSGSSAEHTCAILSDGSVRCWGNNFFGQLGNGQTSNGANRPVEVRW